MDIFERLLAILGPILLIVVVGFLYAKKRRPNLDTANTLNIELFTPLLIFSVLSQKHLTLSQYLPLALVAISIVLMSGLLSIPLARRLGVNRKTFLPPMMFRNAGNLGLPMLVLAFGEDALAPAVILFIVENTLHFSVGMRMLRPQAALVALFKIPMLQATIAGLLFASMEWRFPKALALGVEMLGQISIPLMLFSLGARLAQTQLKAWRVGLIAGLWAPLVGVACAGIALSVASVFVSLPTQHVGMLLIFSALPPAVLNFLLAEKLNQEPEQVASIVLIGNLCSIISMPLVLVYAFTL